MLGSISPVGEAARRQRWWLTASVYTVASTLGGAAVGTVLGVIGQWAGAELQTTPATRLGVLGVVVVAGAAADARRLPWTLPTWHRQVDERWLTTYRGWVYGAGFGLQLGAGVVTIVTSALTYGALAAALLSGSWRQGLIIGVVFGAVRSVPLLAAGVLRTPDRLHAVTRRVVAAEPAARRVAVSSQIAIAATALVVAGKAL